MAVQQITHKKITKFDTSNPNPSLSSAPYRIFNIGNSNPVKLNEYIKAKEEKKKKRQERSMRQ